MAADGANIAIAAKTAEPHPKLPGTIYTAAQESKFIVYTVKKNVNCNNFSVEAAGGQALPLICDVRDEQQVRNAVQATVNKFGGIDILINNASAVSMEPTLKSSMKRYDLMQNINARGTFLV